MSGLGFKDSVADKMIDEATGLKPDGWNECGQLDPGWETETELDPHPFRRLRSVNLRGYSFPVQLEVTGHKIRSNSKIGTAVRCAITFLVDGETNETYRGWLKVSRQ